MSIWAIFPKKSLGLACCAGPGVLPNGPRFPWRARGSQRVTLTLTGAFSCLDSPGFKRYNFPVDPPRRAAFSRCLRSMAGADCGLRRSAAEGVERRVLGRMPNVAWLWPGLPQLWARGSWWGLALAVAFTLLLNVLLVASLIWTEWLRSGVLWAGWSAVAALWACSAWVSWTGFGELTADGPQEDWFTQAQTYYLQSAWYEAEALLKLCLKKNRRDIQARLLLASLQRRTGRIDEATEQLGRLDRQDNLGDWQFEIDRLRALIGQDHAEQEEPPEPATHSSQARENEAPDKPLEEAA